MPRKLYALALLVGLFAAATSLSPKASPAPAPAGPGGVIELHERLFEALDAFDYTAAAELLDEDLVKRGRETVLFLDNGGETPFTAWGRDASKEPLMGWAHSTGLGTRIVRQQVECHSDELSYAVLEFERFQQFTDGSRKLRRFRSTSLVRMVDGRWKLFHWHVSPAEDDGQAIKGG